MAARQSIEERFWAKVDKSGECWIWTGGRDNKGYGVFTFDGRSQRAHRVSWQLTHGPIPTGLCGCHRCDVRLCVNPSHLFLGTVTQNNADMVAKGRSVRPKGEAHPWSKLTESDVLAIRNDTRTLRMIAADYGVSRKTVGHVRTGKNWKHVAPETVTPPAQSEADRRHDIHLLLHAPQVSEATLGASIRETSTVTPPAQEPETPKLTRIEVIDESGRIFVKYADHIELSHQDDGRTLKAFIHGPVTPAAPSLSDVEQAIARLHGSINAEVNKWEPGIERKAAIDALIAAEIERLKTEIDSQKTRANKNAIRAAEAEERADRLQIVRDDCVRSEVELLKRAERAEAALQRPAPADVLARPEIQEARTVLIGAINKHELARIEGNSSYTNVLEVGLHQAIDRLLTLTVSLAQQEPT